MSVIPVSLIAP